MTDAVTGEALLASARAQSTVLRIWDGSGTKVYETTLLSGASVSPIQVNGAVATLNAHPDAIAALVAAGMAAKNGKFYVGPADGKAGVTLPIGGETEASRPKVQITIGSVGVKS